jgi:hypothetical protein
MPLKRLVEIKVEWMDTMRTKIDEFTSTRLTKAASDDVANR